MTAVQEKQDQLLEDAGKWHALMHAGKVDRKTEAAFQHWLGADEAHADVYNEFEQVYQGLDLISLAAGVDVDEALNRRELSLWQRVGGWFTGPGYAWRGLAAVAAVALLVVGYYGWQGSAQPVTYQTDVAELRDIILEDGTEVTLGAKSALEVQYTGTARRMALLSGVAFFDVAKDNSRPFEVQAADAKVSVLGTRFEVKSFAGAVQVAVEEGLVEVSKPATDASERRLSAGEKILVSGQAALPQVEAMGDVALGAWRDGRLAYENAPLDEIIADVNRYAAQPVRLASADLGALRSTIAFSVDGLDQFFDVISAVHNIDIITSPEGAVLLQKKS